MLLLTVVMPLIMVLLVGPGVGIVILVFLLVLGIEVLILDPDLRANGLHGVLASAVLGFVARPVMLYLDFGHLG